MLYCIYPKYLDTLTPYSACPKIWRKKKKKKKVYFTTYWFVLNSAGWVANSVDPDQMLHNAASDLGLHCLLRPFVPIFMVIRVF